jgi:hypothetical protein
MKLSEKIQEVIESEEMQEMLNNESVSAAIEVKGELIRAKIKATKLEDLLIEQD